MKKPTANPVPASACPSGTTGVSVLPPIAAGPVGATKRRIVPSAPTAARLIRTIRRLRRSNPTTKPMTSSGTAMT